MFTLFSVSNAQSARDNILPILSLASSPPVCHFTDFCFLIHIFGMLRSVGMHASKSTHTHTHACSATNHILLPLRIDEWPVGWPARRLDGWMDGRLDDERNSFFLFTAQLKTNSHFIARCGGDTFYECTSGEEREYARLSSLVLQRGRFVAFQNFKFLI